MNSIERVAAAFQKRQPDKLPIHHLGFSASVASGLLGREAYVGGGIQQWREAVSLWQGEDAHQEFVERSFQDAVDVALLADQDMVRVTYWRLNRKPTRRIDKYTFLYEYGPEENWKVLQYDPKTEQSRYLDYKPAGPVTFADLERQLDWEEKALADYRPTEADFGFEIRAQSLLGHERVVRVGGIGFMLPQEPVWLEATLLRPDLVERYFDIAAEKAVRNIEFLAPQGFRYLFGGGDLASNHGPLYSPRVFHGLALPRIRRISEACHRYGCYHLYNSDGNTWALADDLFDKGGVDGYYEIDRRAGMDLLKLRERFPYLTLIGNISSHTVCTGTREQVIAETRACLEEAHQAQGVIVGVSNYFVAGTPIDNVVSLLETIRKYR